MKCCQCNNLAVFQFPFGPLCLGCSHKFQQINNANLENLERQINYLSDEIDSYFGLSGHGARFPERKRPIIQNAPVTMNNILIDRSIVGSVNTGYIHQLEVSINSVSQTNTDEADKIKEFAEAVLKDEELEKTKKEEVIQQLDFLTQQLRLTADKRNKGVIKSVVLTIAGIVNFSASLVSLWGPVKALFDF